MNKTEIFFVTCACTKQIEEMNSKIEITAFFIIIFFFFAFDWKNNSVFNEVEKATIPLAPNAYDKLSYQVQLQMNVCANPDKYAGEDFEVVDRVRLKTYHVELIGREPLKTEVGTLNTIHLRQYRPDKRDGKDTQIWLAADWGCILVRLDQYDKDDLYTLKFISAKINGTAVTGK